MIVAGIMGHQGKVETANIINLILSSAGQKVSVADSKGLVGLEDGLIKKYLTELKNNNVDIFILKLDTDHIGEKAIKGLNFDIIVYTDGGDGLKGGKTKDMEGAMGWLFSIMDAGGMVIANFDDSCVGKSLDDAKGGIITYGFNSKADVTASSIGDTVFEGGFLCCLQGEIPAKNGQLVEPQEYIINISPYGYDRHNALAAVAFAIINGVDLNFLEYTCNKIQ